MFIHMVNCLRVFLYCNCGWFEMSFDREHKQFERDAHETSHKHQMILGI